MHLTILPFRSRQELLPFRRRMFSMRHKSANSMKFLPRNPSQVMCWWRHWCVRRARLVWRTERRVFPSIMIRGMTICVCSINACINAFINDFINDYSQITFSSDGTTVFLHFKGVWLSWRPAGGGVSLSVPIATRVLNLIPNFDCR